MINNPTKQEVAIKFIIAASIILAVVLIIIFCIKGILFGIANVFGIILTSKWTAIIVAILIVGYLLWKFFPRSLPSVSSWGSYLWKVPLYTAIAVLAFLLGRAWWYEGTALLNSGLPSRQIPAIRAGDKSPQLITYGMNQYFEKGVWYVYDTSTLRKYRFDPHMDNTVVAFEPVGTDGKYYKIMFVNQSDACDVFEP